MRSYILVWVGLLSLSVQGQDFNGFDVTNGLIPVNQIHRGGPPRDGIPSIDSPNFNSVGENHGFDNNTQVLGVYFNGVAKAYPINIMDYHEIVNDHFNGKPVVVTYCPLCGSGIAFDSNINDQATTFGVSGLLYNSDVLLYDRTSFSLWSQIMAKAVTGPSQGQELVPISTQRMTLGSWKKLHPKTLILSSKTGFGRNYQVSPYGNYDQENRTYFPVSNDDDTFHKKEWVFGVEVNDVFKAYPIRKLAKIRAQELQDELNGISFTLTWGSNGENVQVKTADGEEIVGFQMFWFAWAAFHPDTEVY